jgi:hypothetical protein
MEETWASSSPLGDQSQQSPITDTMKMKMKSMVAVVVICVFLQVFDITNCLGGFKSAENLMVLTKAETPLSVSVDRDDGTVSPTALPEDNAAEAESDGINSASNDQSSDEIRENPESPYDVLNPSPPQKEPEITKKSEEKVKVTVPSPLEKKSKITETLPEKVKVSKSSVRKKTPSTTVSVAANSTVLVFNKTKSRNAHSQPSTSRKDPATDDFDHENQTAATAAKKELLLLSSYYPKKILLPAGRRAKSSGYRDKWLTASFKKNVALTYIPKVMCSSIRDALNMFECGGTSRCSEARKNKKIKDANISNMTRVLFIRDPFERAYSAYTNSVKNRYISIGPCESSAHCTFGQWVDAIAKNTKTAFRNEHFDPQVNIAQMDKMHYHYLLRMSSSVDQQFFWNNLLGMTKSFKSNESLKSNITLSDKNNITLSDKFKSVHLDTFEKLALIYDADLKLWGRALKQWTPRQTGEVTTFDLYRAADGQFFRKKRKKEK